ncbi:MAG: DNA topoisomerase VI subunit B [Acidobacteria bacterium]|nr:DNA topoisomerase VI subunit B [Acidobacteriota bacterium]
MARPTTRKTPPDKPASRGARAGAAARRAAQPSLFEAPPPPEPDEEPEPEPRPARAGRTPARRRPGAAEMAAQQREISVSEFFTKNRHLLGFDNPRKALLTTVKEAVDNALDACEEAGILPEVEVVIEQHAEDRLTARVRDNGPGIVKDQIPKVFGKLLYGSKFHRYRQSRGQQGIGISAAGMYGLLTTGRPVVITSRTSPRKPAHHYEIAIDTRHNRPEILRDEQLPTPPFAQGTEVAITLEGQFTRGRRSVEEYLELTALANPHATVRYTAPGTEPRDWTRVTDEAPPEPREIRPHPHGVELGTLLKILRDSSARHLAQALADNFSRVTARVAAEICEKAQVSAKASPRTLDTRAVERLYRAIPAVKIQAPPTNCLVPIGAGLIERALRQRIPADFFASCSRPPAVYRGNPFLVEVGLAYGGGLPADDLVEVLRFANRVPLVYQAGACSITKAVVQTNWKAYGLQQGKGAPPVGPAILFVHLASVWVPFTSESKEAIASYPEIIKEIRLALMDVGRKLGVFLNRRARLAAEEKKQAFIGKYIPQIGIALQQILALPDSQRDRAVAQLKDILERSRKM